MFLTWVMCNAFMHQCVKVKALCTYNRQTSCKSLNQAYTVCFQVFLQYLFRQASARFYAHAYLTWLYACLHSLCRCACVCLTHSQCFCQSHPSFCLPHTLVLRNTRLISNSFLDPLHSNYQRRVRGKVSTWEHAVHSPFWCTLEYFKSRGETISSWHIINYTCCSFPLGRSADTLENKSPDVVLNQKDTAWEVGMPWKLVQMAFLNVGV